MLMVVSKAQPIFYNYIHGMLFAGIYLQKSELKSPETPLNRKFQQFTYDAVINFFRRFSSYLMFLWIAFVANVCQNLS